MDDLERMLNGYFVKAVYPDRMIGDMTLYELVDLIMPLIKSKLEEEKNDTTGITTGR